MSQEVALESSVESAFGDAFGIAPPPPPEKVATPEPEAPAEGSQDEPVAAEAEAAAEGEAQAQPAEPEPEFEFEYDGKVHKLIGKETIKAELAKARDYSQKTEQIARARDALIAQAQMMDTNQKFQAAIFNDITELRALDARLEAFGRVDWNAAIDTNFTEAMKLQEQRNQAKALRDAKLAEITQKQQQFSQGQAQAAQQLLAAEGQALLAKLPEWRNSEKAATERQALQGWLQSQGFDTREIDGLTDHRAVVVARKAWMYDQLMAQKDSRVKQAREAPPMVRPGAAPAKPDGRTQFARNVQKVRELGTKGNTKAQEQLVERMFGATFKLDKPA